MPILRKSMRSAKYEFHASSLPCSDGTQEGLNHVFEGTKTQCERLYFIMQNFGSDVVEIKWLNKAHTCFSFNTKKHGYTNGSSSYLQRIFFKMARYTRSENIEKILIVTADAIDMGVRADVAFLMAHYQKLTGYNSIYDWFNLNLSRIDAIQGAKYVPFKTLKGFVSRRISTISCNNYYQSGGSYDKQKLIELVKNGSYLEAEQLLMKHAR